MDIYSQFCTITRHNFVHTAILIKASFTRNYIINVLYSLSSPNMSFFDNLWTWVRYHIELKTLNALEDVKSKVANTPNNMNFTFINKCVELMSKRFQAIK